MLYRLGLDIGITSVGWAVLALEQDESMLRPFRIQDLGVRIFDKAEDSKTGASLALPRREARTARRRLRRRRHRISRVKRLLESQGLISAEQIERLYAQQAPSPDVYRLRVAALDKALTTEELARVLIHIAHRRGFQSNRKSELKDGESGKLLKAVQENESLMRDKGYRTVAEMLVSESATRDVDGHRLYGPGHEYTSNVRNKAGEYRRTVSRHLVVDEVRQIFKAQRMFGNELMSEEFEEAYLQILCSQRNYDDGPGGNSPYGTGRLTPDGRRQSIYERMVGLCTFEGETGERRAPCSSYSFERFQLLTKVINLRVYRRSEDGSRVVCRLTEDERARVIDCAYEQGKITYKKLRKLLNMQDADTFAGLTYSTSRAASKTEDAVFVELKFYHEVKKAFQRAGMDVHDVSHELLDQIGWVLSVWKSDDNRKIEFAKLGLADDVIDELLALNGSKFGHLSLKAIRKIIPFMESGHDYDEACAMAGYQFQAKRVHERQKFLPPISADEITNPVVRRGVSQAIKVINAVIRKYGSPESIHIEMAREMSKTLDERRKIEKAQTENQKNNEKIKEEIREILQVTNVSGRDIVKYKLFKQQQGRCMYSGESLEIGRLFEPGYAEIDHIIPYGVSFDDSYDNKVLVKAEQNRQKGNRTPLEYLHDKPEQRAKFLSTVESLQLPHKKKNHLLTDKCAVDLELEDFRERNLSDTRYITRALMNHIQEHLLFAETPLQRKKRVVCVNGAVTAYMRARWGLTKDRGAGDKHHAADAVVVACIGDALIQRVTKYDKFKRNALADRSRYVKQVSEAGDASTFVDRETGEMFTWSSFDERRFLPEENFEPWPFFRDELLARLSDDADKNIRAIGLSTYPESEQVRSIFISRMPTRKITGAAHKETVRSPRIVRLDDKKGTEIQVVVSKVDLTDLKLKDGEIKDYFRPEDDRRLYETLRARLIQFGGDAKEAFKEPVYKISSDGSVRTPVKKVKIQDKLTLGVSVHGGRGIAENGGMVRIDIFEKGGKHFFVPIYVADTLKEELPNRLATAHKPYSEWRVLDDTYRFKFSLYPNDLVMIKPGRKVEIKYNDGKKEEVGCRLMYFVGANISAANIELRTHDGFGRLEGLGIQNVHIFDKYTVDVLGDIRPVRKEKRMPFYQRRKEK